VISGCSSGGKSTLLEALRRLGHSVVEEPGRRIVKEELETGGRALPWVDPEAFLRRAIEVSLADRTAVESQGGWVFFDRGLVDAAAGLEEVTGEPVLEDLGRAHRYHPMVFLAPPWPEIYVSDAERRHGLDAAMQEYERLTRVYPQLGYSVRLLPKTSVAARAAFVLDALGSA